MFQHAGRVPLKNEFSARQERYLRYVRQLDPDLDGFIPNARTFSSLQIG